MDIPASRGTRAIPIGALVISVILGVLLLIANRSFYHDDAFITLRYARHWLTGDGIVWNPGERVQGYSNFFHLVLISALGRAGTDLVLASRLIGGAALGVLVLALLWFRQASRREGRAHPLDMLPAVLVAASCPLIVWAVGGLEGTLFTLLCASGALLFLWSLTRPRPGRILAASGASLALAALTRPDGVLFLAISGVFLLGTRDQRLRKLLTFLVPAAALLVPYLVWQVSYYGDFVPNTYYAKAGSVSPSRWLTGASYVWRFAASPPFVLLWLVPSALLARKAIDRSILYLSALVVSYLLFIVYVGGDHMQASRLLLPIVPPASLLLYELLRRVLPRPGPFATGAVYASALALCVAQGFDGDLNSKGEDAAAFFGTIVGKHIETTWPEGSLVALNTAGSTPYYAPRFRYIDMLGLNDRHIARRRIEKAETLWQAVPGHFKGDGAYVLSRDPDFIILGPAYGTPMDKPWFLSDFEMANDPRFLERYEVREIQLDRDGRRAAAGGLHFTYYQKVGTGRSLR